uniref:Putative intracellular signal transduction n=1 Tax=Ixodes scapularis TaxID=6945 RepID=A0A4D5RIV4_IXOSC
MVDVLNVMLLCWAIVGLLVYFVGTVLTNRLGRARVPAPTIKTTPDDGLDDVEGPVASQRSATAQLGAAARRSQAEVLSSSFPVHATGSDPDAVLWTNRILAWLLGRKEHQFVSEPWIQALNEKLARSPSKHGVVVEFECVHPDSTKPKLHDVHVVLESKESLTVTTGITCERVILVIKVKRPNDADKAMHRYNLLVEKLSGKLKVCCISTEQLFVVRFVQRPDIKVSLQSGTGENKPHSVDQRALDDIILESVVDALSYTVTDLSCSGQKDFPNFKHREPVSEIIQHTQLDQMNSVPSLAKHDQRLLVKVIKASNLAGTKGCKEVYCVVELDEPPHRCTTTSAKETANPFWDEHFLFTLDQNSSEVLFELYDKSKPAGENFLGLGIVGISELRRVPSQRQIITLQSRPLEYDNITGSLTVEFLYMEGSQIPVTADSQMATEFSQQNRIVEKNSRITSDGRVITTTTIKRSPTTENGSSLTEAALKELEAKGRSPTATKSTLIIHSVQREVACPSFKSDETPLSISPSSLRKQDHNSVERSASSSCSEAEGEGASEKPKKRTLLGKIRKRLSFKKNRSKSVEVRPDAESASRSSSRSVSTDRAKSVPLGRNSHLDVPGARNNGSTRSSISEGSGISAASSRTFVSDKSLLVVEAKEDGVLRHYLIPPSLAHRSKWRRKGVKLHIYNDHVFVAKHLPGGTACHICARLLTRRLGKQGYMCRGCNLLCHKSCHVKTETVCKNSSVGTMQMEPVEDPHPPRMKAS